MSTNVTKKLTLSKTTLKHLGVRTSVKTGAVPNLTIGVTCVPKSDFCKP